MPTILNRARYRTLLASARQWLSADLEQSRQGLILMPVCGRPEYLAQVLAGLDQSIGVERHTIVFSQDGNDPAVSALIADWQRRYPSTLIMRHARPYFAVPNMFGPLGLRHEYLISANTLSLLRYAFDWHKANWIILLEDDLVPSHDFFEFFESARTQILARPMAESRVLAVCGWSNWNFSRSVSDAEREPSLLHQIKLTRFGSWAWSIDAARWPLLRSAWRSYFVPWDLSVQRLRERKNLLCATPVVSRVVNIGMTGVNFREDPDNPSPRWATQSVLTAKSAVTFDPNLPFETDIVPPSQVRFADGGKAGTEQSALSD